MTRKLTFETTDAIGLDEYLELIGQTVNPEDIDSVLESAELLYRLSLDKKVLSDFILEPIKARAMESQSGNTYSDASLILGETSGGKLKVRANIWKVPEERGGAVGHEKRLYAYEAPHDHNFDFLTVGYFGPGYRTELWQYNYSDDLMPGDVVELQYIGFDNLGIGDVMHYEKSKDIHSQFAPEDLSISINLLVSASDLTTRQQFYFDTDNGQVGSLVGGPVVYRGELLDMAGALGLVDAIEPLLDIARNYPCIRTRRVAAANLVRIDESLSAIARELDLQRD